MDTPLAKLLKDISNEYGCDDDYIKPIIIKYTLYLLYF